MVRSFLAMVLLLLIQNVAVAQESVFEADDKLAKLTRLWAEEFIAFASNRYNEELDWSQVSIKYLDEMVDDLHETYKTENPPDEDITPVARAIGSYVGEVYRIFYGGSWGWLALEDGTFPAIQSENGAHFLPFVKMLQLIKTHEDPDVWEYFQLLTAQ